MLNHKRAGILRARAEREGKYRVSSESSFGEILPDWVPHLCAYNSATTAFKFDDVIVREMNWATIAIVVWLASSIPFRKCLDNGLAITAPMGYNTWNAFHEDIDETMVRESAEILISSGLAAAGYTYFNLDGRALPLCLLSRSLRNCCRTYLDA